MPLDSPSCHVGALAKMEASCEGWLATAARGVSPNASPAEWPTILAHVRAADLPEPPSVWAHLGRDAGFHDVRDLFTDPIGLYTVFCFRP